MYSVSLCYTNIDLSWYVYDNSAAEIISQGQTSVDSDVQNVFDENIWTTYRPKDVRLVLFCKSAGFQRQGTQFCEFRKEIAYLYDLGVYEVRLAENGYFDATVSLIHMGKTGINFEVDDELLMIYNEKNLTDLDVPCVFRYKKCDFGWRSRVLNAMGNLDKNVVKKNFIPAILAACKVDVKKLKNLIVHYSGYTGNFKMFSFFDQSKIIKIDLEPEEVRIAAIVYLIKIYTNKSMDYSCYVPIGVNLSLGFRFDNVLLPFYDEFSSIPGVKTIDVKSKVNQADSTLVCGGESCFSFPFADIKGNIVRHSVVTSEHRMFGYKVQIKEDSEFEMVTEKSPRVFEQFYPRITVTRDYVSARFYKNGIWVDVVDVNGLFQIPTRISFMGDVPVFGSAVTDSMNSLKHSILDLQDAIYFVNHAIFLKDPSLLTTPDNVTVRNVIVKTPSGLKKVPPLNIFAVMIKSVIKLVEQQSQQSVEAINIHCDPRTLLGQLEDLIKIEWYYCCAANFYHTSDYYSR